MLNLRDIWWLDPRQVRIDEQRQVIDETPRDLDTRGGDGGEISQERKMKAVDRCLEGPSG